MGTLSKTVGFSLYPCHWVPANNTYLWFNFGVNLINYEKGSVIALYAVLAQDVGPRTYIVIHHRLH